MRKILSRGKEENDYYVPPLPWETTGASFSPITCFVRINCGLIEQSRGKKTVLSKVKMSAIHFSTSGMSRG